MNTLRALLVAAALAVPALAGTRSSPIAITPDDKLVATVNPDTNSVSVFDVSQTPVKKLGEVKIGLDPASVAIHPTTNVAYVACAKSGTVVPVNLLTRRKQKPIVVGAEPVGVAISPNGTRLYVACASGGTVQVLDLTGARPFLLNTVDLNPFGGQPGALSVTDDGDASDSDETVFVTIFFGQLIPGNDATYEGFDNGKEGRVFKIDSDGLLNATPIRLGPMANTGFNSNGQFLPANGLTPAVPSTNPQTFTTPTGAFPNQLAGIAIHPTNGKAYVVSTGASPNGPLRFNSNVQGLVSVFDTSMLTEITAAQTDPTVRRTAPLNLNQGVNLATTPSPRLFNSNPVAMAWRPDGSDAWVAIQNSDLVTRLTVDAGGIPTIGAPLVAGPSQIVRVDLQDVSPDEIPGKAPRGIVINSTGTRLFVSNFVSRSVTEIDITNGSAPAIVSTFLSTKLPRPRSRDAEALLGAEMFYTGRGPDSRMSSESWGGCIVCHPNGRSDNVTWMFDGGPRQTISLDGTFSKKNPKDQRILNWSAVRDENHDFELNTRGVFGGRGLIDDDRLFLAIGGASGAAPADSGLIEQFHQFTGAVTPTNGLVSGANTLPGLTPPRRDFGIVTLDDNRVFIIGGRTGSGPGTLVGGMDAVIEFNPRTNTLRPRSSRGFTPRHSLGAAAVMTSRGIRIYAVGGYTSTDPTTNPAGVVEEFDPARNRWRTVASLPQDAAQFGIVTAGGINSAAPLQLIHIVGGNVGPESTPSLATSANVQRFHADPAGPGVWSTFNPSGLTVRRNHGIATAIRGSSSRIFVIGGQDAGGTVLDTVEEYLADSVSAVLTPHTSLPASRAKFGIGSTLSTNQIYVMGGVNGAGADQTTVFEYTIANNGPVVGPLGTPSGTWVTRNNLSAARSGLGVTSPPGVTNFLPAKNAGRDPRQDAIATWIARKVRPVVAPTNTKVNSAAKEGRVLFGMRGLVIANESCATCHGGAKWTRSKVDFGPPPSPADNVGLGHETITGLELRGTKSLPFNTGLGQFGVLRNVGTFVPNTPGGAVNEIRSSSADISQTISPLGNNGFNPPSLLGVAAHGPYFHDGRAQALEAVLDGSTDTGTATSRPHFVPDPDQRAKLVEFLRSIDQKTPIFP